MMLIDEDTGMTDKTPKHVWAVGALALLWNGFGALDYVMTQTRNEGYMAGFSQEQLDFFYGLPVWAVTAWAIAIWGSVAGSVLILLRNRYAAPVFLVSLAAMLISFFHNIVLAGAIGLLGGVPYLIFTGLIVLIGVGLAYYSHRMRAKGILN